MAHDEFSKTALTAVVAAFEERLAEGEPVDWRSYLPSLTNAQFENFALEMILVDIHHQWRRGVQRTLADYLANLPPQFRQNATFLRQVAVEEWRCRHKAGDAADLGALLAQYGLPDDGERPLDQPEPRPHQLSKRLSDELDALLAKSPEPFGFRVVEPLGNGQLSRVFLGEQPQVGGRKIVVKVGIGPAQEIEALGRLHHENIVPLYWAECDPPYYVLCMPYFGRATLQRFLRDLNGEGRGRDSRRLWEHLGGRIGFQPEARVGATFEEGALWLASRIARGLAHAHANGVIHGDVKPANILLASNGQPLLLDFNLAALGDRLPMGGTFYYMSPEQLAAFRNGDAGIDAPSDIFNLGVVLYELLCGRRPFPDRPPGTLASIDQMLDDRRQPPDWDGVSVSPAARAIVETCLAYRPEGRYATCADLLDDLDSHLHDKPLRHAPNRSYRELGRKQARRTVAWFTRPAPLKTTLVVAVFALVGSALLGYRVTASYASARRAGIQKRLDDFRIGFSIDEGRVDRTLAWLRSIEHLELEQSIASGWTERGTLLWLGCSPAERQALKATALQIEALASKAIDPFRRDPDDLADRLALKPPEINLLKRWLSRVASPATLEEANDTAPTGQEVLPAVRHLAAGSFKRAKTLLDEAQRRNPDDFWTRFWVYKCYSARGHYAHAVAALATCRALRPESMGLLLLEAAALLRAGYAEDAEVVAEGLIAARYELGEAHRIRGWARFLRGRFSPALADFELAAVKGADGPALRLSAAAAAELAADPDRSREELAKIDDLPARSASDWMAVVAARLQSGGAAQDGVDEALSCALELEPENPQALACRAMLLLLRDKRPHDAVALLEPRLKNGGGSVSMAAILGEAYVQLGRRDEAMEVVERISKDPRAMPVMLLRAASIAARCSKLPGDHEKSQFEALDLLRRLQKLGALSRLDLDHNDFRPLRERRGFEALQPSAAARALGPRPELRPPLTESVE